MEDKTYIPNHLGAYLKLRNKKNVELHFLTGISRPRLTTLSNPENDSLTVKEFYLISLAIDADIDDMSDTIFESYVLSPKDINKEFKPKTKYDNYLFQMLMSQKDISSKTSISEYRISTLRNNPSTILLAHELHLTCKALDRKVSNAYAEICGHFKLNTEEQQKRLKESYYSKLAAEKEKRVNEKNNK